MITEQLNTVLWYLKHIELKWMEAIMQEVRWINEYMLQSLGIISPVKKHSINRYTFSANIYIK